MHGEKKFYYEIIIIFLFVDVKSPHSGQKWLKILCSGNISFLKKFFTFCRRILFELRHLTFLILKKKIQIPFLWIYLAEISQKDQILDQINSRYQYFAMFGAMEMCVILQYIALLFIFYIPPV